MTARLAAYHAVHLLDQGQPCDAELMNAKLINVELALDSARDAMEIHAAAGCSPTAPSSAILRDAHHIFAPAGTSDIQRLRLAEVALGLAKGPWSQRLSDSYEATHRTALTPPRPLPAFARHSGDRNTRSHRLNQPLPRNSETA